MKPERLNFEGPKQLVERCREAVDRQNVLNKKLLFAVRKTYGIRTKSLVSSSLRARSAEINKIYEYEPHQVRGRLASLVLCGELLCFSDEWYLPPGTDFSRNVPVFSERKTANYPHCGCSSVVTHDCTWFLLHWVEWSLQGKITAEQVNMFRRNLPEYPLSSRHTEELRDLFTARKLKINEMVAMKRGLTRKWR